ncbi:MAG TPA: hypothetical protein VGM64_08230 [Lacunisphaera sp.]
MNTLPRLILSRSFVRMALALLFFAGSRLGATTVIPPDFDQLVNDSDYIIRAVVKSVDSEYQTTNSGGKKIVTKVALDVKEVIAGTPPNDVVLEILGGRVGNERMVVEGAPNFKVGDEDILFVRGNGHTIVPLVAMMHGRYPIMRDAATGRKYMARENRVPLADTAEISQPILKAGAATGKEPANAASQAMTPEEFIQRIKSAVNPRYVRTKS